MDVDAFLSENKERYEIIQSLQEQLNHITQESYKDVIKFIEDHKYYFLNSHEDIAFFLYNINTFTVYNFTKAEILLDIIIHFEKEIKSKLEELEIFDIIYGLLCCSYYLFDKGFYSIESIVSKSVVNGPLFAYFYPEIDEYDHEMAEKLTKKYYGYKNYKYLIDFLDFVTKNKEQHIENRKHCYNPLPLHKAIREDNIEEFQSLIAKNNFDYNYNFEFSFYERTLTENQTPSLIQIAATYGAVHIFKFLWMQKNIHFDDNLICYAISGRNYDIIHICEEKCSRKRALMFSINSNQHELTDYFIDSLQDDEIEEESLNGYEKDDNNMYEILNIRLLHVAYQSINYHIFLPCLKKIVYILDNIEDNVTNRNYFSFLQDPTFDLNLFKLLYSHKNKNIDLFDGLNPIFSQWIYSGMTDEIKFVLPTFDNSEINEFLQSINVNIRIANIIIDFLIYAQDLKEFDDTIKYFKNKINFSYLLRCCNYYDKHLIEKLLRFVNIKLNPDLFVNHLLMHTSRKFISSLFKLKLNLGNSKEEFAMVLRKKNFNEEADNL